MQNNLAYEELTKTNSEMCTPGPRNLVWLRLFKLSLVKFSLIWLLDIFRNLA